MQISKEQSDTFWQMKAVAIFTIFFAHMPGHEMAGNMWMIITFNVIGMMGVPLFMLLSGFFNKGCQIDITKTLKSLFVPLLIWGTICFTLHIIKTPTTTPIVDWIKFVGGSKSIFYFVPMLFCCMMLTKYINDYVLLVLGVLSQFVTTFTEFIPYNDVWTLMLNPFNFITYFSIGRLFRMYNVLLSYKGWWSFISFFIIVVFLLLT